VVRLAEVGAAIAQAASAHRDLVGLTVFDEETAAVTAPARTRIHTVELLRKLGEAAARLPDPGQTNADLLARAALPLAEELYPDLLRQDVNSRPWRMYWRPIADSRWLWVVLALLCLPALLVRPAGIEALARAVNALSRDGWSVFAKLGLALLLFFLPLLLAGGIWFVHGVRGLLPPYRARLARRKPLAALFALLDDTGPAAIERFVADDELFAARATRFLLEHRVRLPLVLYDKHGRYRFRSEGKIAVLAASLLRAVGRARDNELYVLLADLTELGRDVQPLVNAATVARARHHQVLVIVPWPADVPTEERRQPGGVKIGALVRSVLAARYQRGFAELRTELARAGATVIRVTDGDPVRLVLERLNQLRGARIRR
jgi:hypothetical protein